ncbi:hypothetical protein F0562_001557 [Nyssa sinensis]|uniref:Disease resistance protein RPM1-like n=1 Tax=Nyssa sinensis TaxID=561372 RepID=A0A5J5C3A6_9ASTE|nr:hypothetical protein F0562_001557 [Nyssa sinensis]
MAEIAVNLAVDKLVPLLEQELKLLKGVHKEVESVRIELQFIQPWLGDADEKAEKREINDGVKAWVKELRRVSHQMEDVIDEYILRVAQRPGRHGFINFLHKVGHLIIKIKPRHKIASEIQDIRTTIRELKGLGVEYGFSSALSEASGRSAEKNDTNDSQVAALFIEEAEVVGIESQRAELRSWLVRAASKRTVISLVGMGGLGKTTLAKKVFDDKIVTQSFACHACICVSKSYTVKEILRTMIKKFYEDGKGSAPQEIDSMEKESLISKLREYLHEKRYVVLFDDVWNPDFWGSIKPALPDNGKGSRVIITTRDEVVASCSKESPFDRVYKLPTLAPKKAWELFCKKAFQSDYGGHCPSTLEELSWGIINRCGGLPLALVTIAEGFVKENKGKTLEEVGEEYLTELIHRSLVQVSLVDFDGKARSCKVHDLLREIIISKSEGLSFCQLLAKEDSQFDEQTRRLSIHNREHIVLKNIIESRIRSVFIFEADKLPEPFIGTLFTNFKLMKVLDFEDAPLDCVPEEVGNLFHLRYLSVRNTKVKTLPRSIGRLCNLLTLDLKRSLVSELPIEINRLHKLRHLLAYHIDEKIYLPRDRQQGVKIHEGFGCLKALQKLYFVEANHRHNLMKELRELRQLRKLGIKKLKSEDGRALCAAIENMSQLESLDISSGNGDDILDLQFISSLPRSLQRLSLRGHLGKVPQLDF